MSTERDRIHERLQELFEAEEQYETVLELEAARIIIFEGMQAQ